MKWLQRVRRWFRHILRADDEHGELLAEHYTTRGRLRKLEEALESWTNELEPVLTNRPWDRTRGIRWDHAPGCEEKPGHVMVGRASLDEADCVGVDVFDIFAFPSPTHLGGPTELEVHLEPCWGDRYGFRSICKSIEEAQALAEKFASTPGILVALVLWGRSQEMLATLQEQIDALKPAEGDTPAVDDGTGNCEREDDDDNPDP